MNRTALIISYFFPPLGMGGVQRMAKLAKYLPQCGYDVIVLTVKPVRYPAHDPSLLDELPGNVRIFRSGSSDPARIARLVPLPVRAGDRVKTVAKERSGRFWPDSKIGWKRPALRLARHIITKNKIDIIISSSPPVTGHLIAMELKRRFDLPWIADFRDLWESRAPEEIYRRREMADRAYRLLHDIVDTADAVTRVNDSLLRGITAEVETIMGGYDPDDFPSEISQPDTDVFTMCYMGTVGSLHPIEPFFEASRIAAGKDTVFAREIRFDLIGANDSRRINSFAAAFGLEGKVSISPYLPHRAALRRAATAAVSLVSVPGNFPGIITSKIFDCLALPASILASAPKGGEIDRFIDRYQAGICIEPANLESLAEAMLKLHRDFNEGTLWEKRDISDFTRLEAARRFAGLCDRVIDG